MSNTYRTSVTFIRTFIITAIPVWAVTNYSYSKSAITSAVVAGLVAALSYNN